MNKPDKAVGGAANLGEVSNKIYSLLQGLQSEDRGRIMNSVSQLFGDPSPAGVTSVQQPAASRGTAPPAPGVQGGTTAQQYFATKAPQNKGEMLAVAARYCEERNAAQSHSLQDFADFFTQARQN